MIFKIIVIKITQYLNLILDEERCTGKAFSPKIYLLPKVILFLEYVPFELEKQTLENKIKTYRREHGLSQWRFAKKLGVGQTMIRAWEKNRHKPSKTLIENIKSSFNLCPSSNLPASI